MSALETLESLDFYTCFQKTDCLQTLDNMGSLSMRREQSSKTLDVFSDVCSEKHWTETLTNRHAHSLKQWTIKLAVIVVCVPKNS